jgi:hypothetical protein
MPEIPVQEPQNYSELPPNVCHGPVLEQLWEHLRILAVAVNHQLSAGSERILSLIASLRERLQRLPRRVRLAGAILAILLTSGFVFSWAFSSSAKLNVVCQHSFRSAEVSIWIDGDLVYTGTVNGSANKRFHVFGSRSLGLFKTVDVPAGRHTVQVRVTADAEGYDQVKTVSAVFSEAQDNSLNISAGTRGLYLTARGGANVPVQPAAVSSYMKYATSVVLSIFGSGMSAAIAFLVQEFMRSQKARLVAPDSTLEIKS